jgi:hypothetical protein
MNPFTIITEYLQKIPRKVRQGIYLAFALCVVAEFILEEIAGIDTGKTDEILLYIGGYLGIQAGANATKPVERVTSIDIPDMPQEYWDAVGRRIENKE